MGTKLLFWLIFYPLSILPLKILYGITYFLNLINRAFINYRKEVIDKNLSLSFPEKNQKELRKIRTRFYKHLAEIAAEMIKMLTISRKELQKRYYCANPELVNHLFEQGKSVMLMSSHYNNWEWMVLNLDSLFKHHGVGVGKPNTNKIFEKLINKARTRYGTEVVFADTVRNTFEYYENNQKPAAYMMLSDQSPSNPDKSYQTTFLNQPSAILFGSEYFAKKYNIPVLYYEVIKDKKGYYHINIQTITETPQLTSHGEITEKYIEYLEKTIKKQPEFWLWSHKRWKHKITL